MTMWDRERPSSDRRLRAQPGSPPPEVKGPPAWLVWLVLLAAMALIAGAMLMSVDS